jgi:hypothetical protein
MKAKFGIDDEDRFYILFDFVAPDECLWLVPEDRDDETIEGKDYSVTAFETDFSMFQTFSNAFKFQFIRYEPKDEGDNLYRIEVK